MEGAAFSNCTSPPLPFSCATAVETNVIHLVAYAQPSAHHMDALLAAAFVDNLGAAPSGSGPGVAAVALVALRIPILHSSSRGARSSSVTCSSQF
jgi:hypothetical protein